MRSAQPQNTGWKAAGRVAACLLLLTWTALAAGPARRPSAKTAVESTRNAPADQGVVIDGIVAIVNQKAITLSDVEDAAWYVRFSASLTGRSNLTPLTHSECSTALAHLIDEELLLEAEARAGYEPVSSATLNQQIDHLTQLAGGAAPLQQRLRRFHLRVSLLRAMVRRQLDIMSFLDQRLRPSIVAGNRQIEQYYRTQFLPAARARGLPPAPLDRVRKKIRSIIIEQELERQQQKLLQQLRASARIERTGQALLPVG